MKSRTSGLEVKFIQIPREENECSDRLAKAASAEFMNAPEQVVFFVQSSSLIDDRKQMHEIDVEENWTALLKAYLQSGTLLDGKDAARRLKVRASLRWVGLFTWIRVFSLLNYWILLGWASKHCL